MIGHCQAVLQFFLLDLEVHPNIGSSRGVSHFEYCRYSEDNIFKFMPIFNTSLKNHADKNCHNFFRIYRRHLIFFMYQSFQILSLTILCLQTYSYWKVPIAPQKPHCMSLKNHISIFQFLEKCNVFTKIKYIACFLQILNFLEQLI